VASRAAVVVKVRWRGVTRGRRVWIRTISARKGEMSSLFFKLTAHLPAHQPKHTGAHERQQIAAHIGQTKPARPLAALAGSAGRTAARSPNSFVRAGATVDAVVTAADIFAAGRWVLVYETGFCNAHQWWSFFARTRNWVIAHQTTTATTMRRAAALVAALLAAAQSPPAYSGLQSFTYDDTVSSHDRRRMYLRAHAAGVTAAHRPRPDCRSSRRMSSRLCRWR